MAAGGSRLMNAVAGGRTTSSDAMATREAAESAARPCTIRSGRPLCWGFVVFRSRGMPVRPGPWETADGNGHVARTYSYAMEETVVVPAAAFGFFAGVGVVHRFRSPFPSRTIATTLAEARASKPPSHRVGCRCHSSREPDVGSAALVNRRTMGAFGLSGGQPRTPVSANSVAV